MDTAQLSGFLVGLGRLSAEAGILVMLVAAAQWVFRRHLSPRWRCALWLLLAARLLMPFSFSSITSVFNLLPAWPHPRASTPTLESASASAPESPVVITPLPLRNSPSPAPTPLLPPLQITQPLSPSWPLWIFTAWFAGAVLLAGQVLVSSIRLWKRSAKLQPLTLSPTLGALDDCCRQLKVRTRPVLLESFEIKSPALHGLIRPRLLLPKGFIDQFSLAELRFVFLHELAHLKRRDLLTNWVMAALQIIHWFNPLVWFGFARWRADREIACDAMALEAAGQEQNELYGQTILRLLENFSRPVSTPGLVGILEDKRQLRRRIFMIANYAPATKWPVLALLLATGLAAIGLTDARDQSSNNNPSIGKVAMVSGKQPQFEILDVQTTVDGAPASDGIKVNDTPIRVSADGTNWIELNNWILSNAIAPNAKVTIKAGYLGIQQPDNDALGYLWYLGNSLMNGASIVAPGSIQPLLNGADPITITGNGAIRISADGTHWIAMNSTGSPAARDCWDAVARTMPTGITLDTINLADGTKLRLSGTAPADQVLKITVFYDKLRKSEKDGQPLFEANTDGASTTQLEPGGSLVRWSFDLNLKGPSKTSKRADGFNLTILSTNYPGPGSQWAAGYQVMLNPTATSPSPATSANPEPMESAPTVTASSDIANKLIGAWVLVGTPGKVGPVPKKGGRIKFYTGKYYCITQCDPKNGVVIFHHGGTYTLDGNVCTETVQYANPTTMSFIGKTNGHFNIKIEADTMTLIGIDNPWKEVWKKRPAGAGSQSEMAREMTGTWVLVGERGNFAEPSTSGAGYKFITPTDWCVTQADAKTGVVIIHHGGTCTFNGNEYVESVKYADANPVSMPLIGEDNKFTSKVDGDTLTITGIGNPWNEVWKRLK